MEVPVDGVEFALLALEFQQALAHVQDRCRASWRPVQPSQQLLARRLGGDAELREVDGRGIHGVRLRRREHPHGIGRELGEQSREESRLVFLVQIPVQIQGGLGERYASRLTALGQQLFAADEEPPHLGSVARDYSCPLLNGFEHARAIGRGKRAGFKYRGRGSVQCAPKMSKEDQEAVRSSVNMLRTMKPIGNSPQGRATLEQRCTASLKELQKDKYGCDGAKR